MKKQQGVVLVTVLIFLLALMLLSVGALATSQLQIRMSNNLHDHLQTFQAAEAGLRAGEKQVLQPEKPACFSATPLSPTKQDKYPWLKQKSCDFEFAKIPTHYFIEQLSGISCYRVTAWAGLKNNSLVILQSIYAVPGDKPCDEKEITQEERSSWRELN
jgi:Tfp pilus assembly protein PilX